MLTRYPADSLHAVARVVALTVIIDGVPGKAELDMLAQRGILRRLELDCAAFEDVIDTLCADLRDSTERDEWGGHIMQPKLLRAMLDEIQQPALQRELAGILFDVVSADHYLFRAESVLLWEVLDHWKLHLRDIVGLAHERPAAAGTALVTACYTGIYGAARRE